MGSFFRSKRCQKVGPFFRTVFVGPGRDFERLLGGLGSFWGRWVSPMCCKKQYKTISKFIENDFHRKYFFAIRSMRKPRSGNPKHRNFDSEIDKKDDPAPAYQGRQDCQKTIKIDFETHLKRFPELITTTWPAGRPAAGRRPLATGRWPPAAGHRLDG